MNVVSLSDRVRRELTYLSYPSREWTLPRYHDRARVLDVLIVGGGQGGLATAFGLKLERITNVSIVDRNPRGLEGPWRRFARMKELRTPKEVAGIDLGIPSLTSRAWYEAKRLKSRRASPSSTPATSRSTKSTRPSPLRKRAGPKSRNCSASVILPTQKTGT